jgi:glycosyltransferase involved in cell wall biosynthesis
MSKKPLVTFVIPCYNDASYIEQAVNSALEQTIKVEVIVVDDGSDDKTKKVLATLSPKIDVLITQKNQGQSKARNVGINAANGVFIVTLDSDDYFEPQFAEQALSIFEKKGEEKIVTCRSVLFFEDGDTKVYTPNGGDIKHFMFSNGALGTSMFKKEDWQQCGGYDEKMKDGWEDWEFFIRLIKDGGECFVLEAQLFNYRQKKYSTTTRANNNRNQLLSYILKKNKDVYTKYFDSTIDFLIQKLEKEEVERYKNLDRLDYKVGKAILDPMRKFKKGFKK